MILNINKPKNYTSRDVVNVLNKHFQTKKIGHTGTLDPIASGVLIVCTENDTKLVDLITSYTKEYIATIKLGIKTDTLDITGNILETKDFDFTKTELEKRLKSFLGKQMQEVPIYSAVKVNGKKLYEYARANLSVELPKREIEIFDIELIDFHDDLIKFRVVVSKGTYIRSLINDICARLDTVGSMSDLIRTKQGNFLIESSYTIEQILNNEYEEISKEEIFKNFRQIIVKEEDLKLIKNGAIMPKEYDDDYIVYTDESGIFLAVYKTYEKDKSLLKPYKML